MSENVGTSTSHNPKGLHGLYRDNFTLRFTIPLAARQRLGKHILVAVNTHATLEKFPDV
jgi:hypothetical protein